MADRNLFLHISTLTFLLTVSLVIPLSFSVAQQVTSQTDKDPTVIVFIGDSLTDGYGVKKEEAYPHVIGERLKSKGQNVKVINGGISGSVTAEADRRVKFYLKSKPDVIVLALGGNDALKGTPTEVIKKNLGRAIDLAQSEGVKVLLCGIRIFSNFGQDYSRDLEKVYLDLAREKKVELVPFILEGVALDKKLNLPDGKHPNAKGHLIMAETVLKSLEKLL